MPFGGNYITRSAPAARWPGRPAEDAGEVYSERVMTSPTVGGLAYGDRLRGAVNRRGSAATQHRAERPRPRGGAGLPDIPVRYVVLQSAADDVDVPRARPPFEVDPIEGREADRTSLSTADVARSPGADFLTFAVWASTFAGWMLGFSIGPYVFWPLAIVFAVASVRRSRTAINVGMVMLALALGPVPWLAETAWTLVDGS